MNLCLEVTDEGPAGSIRHRWSGSVDLGGDTSGTEMSRALTDHAQRCGVPVAPDWRWWTTTGQDLTDIPSATTVVSAGDTVVLAPTAPTPGRDAIVMQSDAVSTPMACGVHTIGGSVDDDMTVDALPPAAAVVEVHRDGAVDVRRRNGVDGGDGDGFFGSPSEGRAIRFSAHECARGDATFVLAGVSFQVGTGAVDRAPRRGAVNRTPYRPVREGWRDLDPIPAPPSPPRAAAMAITSFVVPLASGIGMAVLLGRVEFLLIVLLAPVALGVVHLVQRRSGRRTFAAERNEYRTLVAERVRLAEREARRARDDAHVALPSAQGCHDIAVQGLPTLWQRAAGGPHLLRVRVGLAERGPVVRVPIHSGGDDALRSETEARLTAACRPPGAVPADVDVDADGAVGICGPFCVATGLARSFIGQMATHHGPEDVVFAAALSPRSLGDLDGVAWMPHTRSEASPLGVAPVAVWADDVERLVAALVEVAARRNAVGAMRDRGVIPRVVLVVEQGAPVDRGDLGRLLDLAPTAGVRVVWFGDDPSLLPRQCHTTVRIGDDGACIESTDPTVDPEHCDIETLDRESLSRMGRALAPCHDAASPTRSGALPASLTLAELPAGSADDDEVHDAWSSSDGTTLEAAVGMVGSGPLRLDLVTHGPHALVAGTSGSGKSELLQTWVAAMAAAHPPERCTFLFVDYKGGATAAGFAELPHLVGSVTNLDPRLAHRALVSLRAELEYRMALLAGRARDLDEFMAVAPEECPPRLVIVVDEFATLVKEVPDFLAGVVDVAQRGRSLGIHMILATQRPAGSVNDDILANTNIRVALRVVDPADSRSVIGTDDAAALGIGRAGRAFVRLGPGSITGAQIAQCTSPTLAGDQPRSAVERLALTPMPAPRDAAPGRSQLTRLVERLAAAHAAMGGSPPRRPWVPELPTRIALDSIESEPSGVDPGRIVTVGLADDPTHQRQRPATVDLEATGGMAVFGSGGSGRTTTVRTCAVSAVAGAAVGDVQLVVLDFAGRSLRALLDLAHTRAVVTGDDVEGACREIEGLVAEVERRRDMLGSARVESWSALAGKDRPPRLCVIIDGFAGLRAALDSSAGHPWWESLQRVLVDGRQVGIHAVVAAERRNDLPAAVLGSIGSRLVLRMAEAEAMTTLGVPRAVARSADLGPGRGFLDGDEVQVAVLTADGPEVTGASEAATLAMLAQSGPDEAVHRDPGLPRVASVPPGPPAVSSLWDVPVGVDERGDLAVVRVDRPVAVVGPHGSGRSNLLARIVDHVASKDGPTGPRRVLCVADDRSPLSLAVAADGTAGVVTTGIVDVVADPDRAAEAITAAEGAEDVLVVVDDAERFDVAPLAGALARWIDQRQPAVVVAERAAASRSLTGMLGVLRRVQPVLVMQPEGAAEVEGLAGRRVRFRPGATFPLGRAVLVDRSGHRIMQSFIQETY